MNAGNRIVILDFGSQYTQLIARRIRELGVFSEIVPFSIPASELQARNPSGIILSGGPSSVYADDAPIPDPALWSFSVPILGICYGLQLITKVFGGEIDRAAKREYGRAQLLITGHSDLFEGLGSYTPVWMSHGDAVSSLPAGFTSIAHTSNSPFAAVKHDGRKIFGIQFHAEVAHTPHGKEILSNFLFRICGCSGDWNPRNFIQQSIASIQNTVQDNAEVVLALSGGVDSTVAAVLLHQAIGERLHCIHVDNGLMRVGESGAVIELFRRHFEMKVRLVDASETFLSKLKGISDPEEKRRIIGHTFIEVFEKAVQEYPRIGFLAQGTLYPDVIESISQKGPSQTIKTHHNVGGLPERMKLKLIEPFRELFKDEVRAIGKELGVTEKFLRRHPFPGPGLAVRILGPVEPESLEILRNADRIFIEELDRAGLYDQVWQAFAVLLPVRTVGVMGDERTYANAVALRAVTSIDGMTADWAQLPHEFLSAVSSRLCNEVDGINRVVYDISSKPPSTIEWE